MSPRGLLVAAWAPLAAACSPDQPTAGSPDTGAAVQATRLSLPVADPDAIGGVVGFDHDPQEHEGAERLVCTDYAGRGFPWCYDGHQGTDYLLEGDWEAMDAGSVEVIAAAAGVVVSTEDGHYDRCHGDLATGEVDCDGHEMIANHVILEHPDGTQTLYWHLMNGSVAVAEGETVACGQVLGRIGSSGMSVQPHLHFEVQRDGVPVDPYAGEASQPWSCWVDQGDPWGLPARVCP